MRYFRVEIDSHKRSGGTFVVEGQTVQAAINEAQKHFEDEIVVDHILGDPTMPWGIWYGYAKVGEITEVNKK